MSAADTAVREAIPSSPELAEILSAIRAGDTPPRPSPGCRCPTTTAP